MAKKSARNRKAATGASAKSAHAAKPRRKSARKKATRKPAGSASKSGGGAAAGAVGKRAGGGKRAAKSAAAGGSVGAVGSQAKLAVAVEIARSTLQRWLADPRWPFARSGPWPASDVPLIKQWAADNLRAERRPGGDPATVARHVGDYEREQESRIRLMDERSDMIELQRAERAGRLISLDEHHRQQLERINSIKARMQTIAADIARDVVGCDEEAALAIIERHLRDLCRRFADG